jgi:hypothetical protein
VRALLLAVLACGCAGTSGTTIAMDVARGLCAFIGALPQGTAARLTSVRVEADGGVSGVVR